MYRRLQQLSRRFELEPESAAVRRLRQLMEAGGGELLKGRAIIPSPKDIGPSGCGKDFERRSLVGKEEAVTQRLLGRIRALEIKTVIVREAPGREIASDIAT